MAEQDPVDAAIRAAAASKPSRCAETDQVHRLRSGEEDVRGHRNGCEGKPQRIVKGAFAVGHRPCRSRRLPRRRRSKNSKQRAFAFWRSRWGQPTPMQLAGTDRAERPAARGLGGADRRIARPRRAHGDGDRRCAGDGGDRRGRGRTRSAPICPPGPLPDAVRAEQFAVFAGVLPEDKYALVKAFQSGGHVVGMCGDGANDAPALRQAQMGIAVSTATDVAKSAAGIVLTEPGLGGIVAAVKEGRMTFQRILTYTLNSITKKIVQVLFLAVGLIMTGQAILTPLLMVIIMITGDFLGMSLTTDNVRPSPAPNAWRIGNLTDRRRHHGTRRVGLLHVHPGFRRLSDGVRNWRAEDAGFCRYRVRQPGDDLYQSRTSASVVVSSQLLAHRFVHRRSSDRLDVGHRRDCNDAFAGLDSGRHACRCGRLRRHPGFGEGSRLSSAWHRLGRLSAPRGLKMKINSKDFCVREGEHVDLSKWPTKVDPVYELKDRYQELLKEHVAQLSLQQQLLYASNRYALLLIFQAMDAAGKDGAISHVMSGVNPQGCQVFSFKHPSATELQHDFLWRTTRDLPERGRSVFSIDPIMKKC